MPQTFKLNDLADLEGKKKTVDDIVRFVKNRNDDNPNYNLLLGSGCSVSSGIDAGYSLTEKWREEIYLSLHGADAIEKEEYDKETAISYLQANCSKWYDSRNEYASLFEYKYNLPKQRRIFVEQLVSNKYPSIGYAYLVKLIEKNFFRTVFTTNFDDLINYSFYNFSRECRPMVCAHDSSINSITVTSKRPKIIKLHGDYLFDDIKNTIRETESLEENMKNKFMEFSKDHGLIVVGYGGNDRSVMDVLNYLLKHEEYFGHGIYWCVRDGANTIISEEVRKLLWKERVYYVPIGGFDEFFAELSYKLASGSILPYETKISVDVTDLLKEIVDSEKAFSGCKFIASDLKKCKKDIQVNAINNQWKAFEFVSGRKRDAGSVDNSFEDIIKRQKIQEKMIEKNYKEAISEGVRALDTNFTSYNIRSEIYFMIADCYKKTGQHKEAIDVFNKLVAFNNENKLGNNKAIYIQISDLIDNYNERVRYLEGKVLEIPESSELQQRLAEAYVLQEEQCPDSIFQSDRIVASFDESIKRDPSLSNVAYFSKFDYLLEKQHADKEWRDCESIIKVCETQDKYDVDVVEMRVKLLQKTQSNSDKIEEYISSVKMGCRIFSRLFKYDYLLLKALEKKAGIEKIRHQMHCMDERYPSDVRYILQKSGVLLSKFRSVTSAIACINDYMPNVSREADLNKMKARLVTLYLYDRDVEKAQSYLHEITNEEMRSDLQKELWAIKCNFEKLFDDFERKLSDPAYFPTISFYIDYSYQLLRSGAYSKVVDLLKPVLEKNGYREEVLVINYELARKLNGDKIKHERLHRVRDSSNSKDVKAAAYMVLSKIPDDKEYKAAIDLIREEIESNYTHFYVFPKFPVFRDVDIEKTFSKSPIPYRQQAP